MCVYLRFVMCGCVYVCVLKCVVVGMCGFFNVCVCVFVGVLVICVFELTAFFYNFVYILVYLSLYVSSVLF
jgi:hypothetical protein